MRKWIIIVFVAGCMPAELHGQSILLGFQLGWGYYQMNEMSEFINDTDIPLDTRVVYDYPPYFIFQPELSWGNDTFSIGLCDAFQSTGARISVKDYTGEYRMDSRVKSHAPALVYKRRITEFKGIQQRLYCKAGMGFTRMVLQEYFELNDEVYFDDSYYFRSMYGFLEPGVSFSYTYRFITLAMNMGYFLQYYSSPLKEEETGSTFWASNSNTNARANWSGIRFGLSLTVQIMRNHQ